MTAPFDFKTFKYRLNPEDLVKLGLTEFRPVSQNEHGYMLQPVDGGPGTLVEHARFCEGLRTGYIEVRRGRWLQPSHVPCVSEDRLVSLLPDETLSAARRRNLWVSATDAERADLESRSEKPIKLSRRQLARMMPAIKARLEATLTAADERLKRSYAAGDITVPRQPSPKTLQRWCEKAHAMGFVGLIDARHRRGNRTSRMTLDESALLNKCVRAYLSLQRPTREEIVRLVGREFATENERRELDGRLLLKKPSRPTILKALRRLPPFQCDLYRLGYDQAIRKWSAHGQGLKLTRPLERVEIDEHTIDLQTIMAQHGLDPLLSDDERKELGLDGKIDRWLVSIAIDCATRCILALRLTRTATEACAISTLDMITTDKGEWADAVGARSSWHHHGTPEHIVTDAGSGYIGERFEAALSDLGVTVERAPAGLPMMRGIIERLFGTLSLKLMPLLSGRTFGDVVRRGDHPSEQRAALTVDDLAFALIRWCVDIYHNEIHEGIGCTPNEKWAELYAKWQCPPPPSARRRRAAFGTRMSRKIGKDGLTVIGVRHNNMILQDWYRDHPQRHVDIRWYAKDIGAIEVKLGPDWYTIPAVFDGFANLPAQHWIAGLRAQRLRNAATIAANQTVIIDAIDAITAVNAAAMKRADVLDFDWTEKRIKGPAPRRSVSRSASAKSAALACTVVRASSGRSNRAAWTDAISSVGSRTTMSFSFRFVFGTPLDGLFIHSRAQETRSVVAELRPSPDRPASLLRSRIPWLGSSLQQRQNANFPWMNQNSLPPATWRPSGVTT